MQLLGGGVVPCEEGYATVRCSLLSLKWRKKPCTCSIFQCPSLLWTCRDLDLKKPIYQKTACYGHFGRSEFPWEVPKKLVF